MENRNNLTLSKATSSDQLLFLSTLALALASFIVFNFFSLVFIDNGKTAIKSSQQLRYLSSSAVASAFGELNSRPYPVKVVENEPPAVTAKAAVVVDVDSEFALYSKNANLKLPPASLVKLATALVAIQNCPLNKVVLVPEVKIAGTVADLAPGDWVTIEELLYAMLLPSGNDAAQILSMVCGNDEQFINSMNSLAGSLGMNNTHFSNPTGLDAPDQYSTASDLVKLAKAVIKEVKLAAVVSSKEVVFDNVNKTREYHFVNLNKLLSETPGVLGIKTGTSLAAGENLITFVNRDNKRVIIVVLGSTDRFGDSKKLIDWVYSSFNWIDFDRSSQYSRF